jgi:hypothetical protein
MSLRQNAEQNREQILRIWARLRTFVVTATNQYCIHDDFESNYILLITDFIHQNLRFPVFKYRPTKFVNFYLVLKSCIWCLQFYVQFCSFKFSFAVVAFEVLCSVLHFAILYLVLQFCIQFHRTLLSYIKGKPRINDLWQHSAHGNIFELKKENIIGDWRKYNGKPSTNIIRMNKK